MFYRFLHIKTLSHHWTATGLSLGQHEHPPAGTARTVHEVYHVAGFWESEERYHAGEGPSWIEDFHTQLHLLAKHAAGPMAKLRLITASHAPNCQGKRGQNCTGSFLAGAHDGDPHGVLSHPEVQAARDQIAAEGSAA